MNKICTSLEQSRKLIELGVDVNTADMYWWSSGKRYYIEAMDDGDFNEEEGHIPAWSLSVLLKLIKSEIYGETIYGDAITYKVDFRKYKFTNDVDLYQIAYGSYKWYEDGSHTWSDMINTGEKEDPIDAAFEMIVWLKENSKI